MQSCHRATEITHLLHEQQCKQNAQGPGYDSSRYLRRGNAHVCTFVMQKSSLFVFMQIAAPTVRVRIYGLHPRIIMVFKDELNHPKVLDLSLHVVCACVQIIIGNQHRNLFPICCGIKLQLSTTD